MPARNSVDQIAEKYILVDCSSGDVTNQVIYADRCEMLRIWNGYGITDALLTIMETDGTVIAKAELDVKGTITIGLRSTAGIKITTTGYTGGYLTGYYSPDPAT